MWRLLARWLSGSCAPAKAVPKPAWTPPFKASKFRGAVQEQAVELFERGFGYGLTAKRLGVPAEAVRHWQKTYRAIGKDGFLAMGVKQARYDYETKVAAASAVVDGGMSKPEAMVRFGIASATPLSMQVPSRSCTRTWDGSTNQGLHQHACR